MGVLHTGRFGNGDPKALCGEVANDGRETSRFTASPLTLAELMAGFLSHLVKLIQAWL
jgi:hypothetical protein